VTEHKRVAVIGAGIAGLVTAKVLRDDAFDVVVFEQEPTIGGVWAATRTYPGLRTNNSRDTYGYSDHPYDRSADLFPTAEQVRRYLASYVARFELGPLIRPSTEVLRVGRRADGFVVPDQRLPLGQENVGLAPEFYRLARRGRVRLRRDTIAAFGGAEVILAPEIASTIVRDGRFRLYRHILPPTEQGVGFIGYASSTACQLTSEISAH
jgi:hypothetical protein